MTRSWRSFTLLIALTSLFASGARFTLAAPGEGLLNRLLAPGPLIEGHKNLEGMDCLKCHDAGKGVPDSKCMECHKELGADVREKRGFHGMTGKSCIACHSDHKGREFDSAKFDTHSFDHSRTGYLLQGKHLNLQCSECHVEKRGPKRSRSKEVRYVGAKTTCVSCHKKNDPHQFKGEWEKKDCNACHGLKTWKEEIRFNHEKDAKFKLEGKHASMSCKECHIPKNGSQSIYKWPDLGKKQCLACHQDVHGQRLSGKFQGGRCTTCHDQSAWKIKDFDHAGVSHFSIKGAHAKLTCTECHKQTQAALKAGAKAYQWNGSGTSCKSCHQDIHKENLSPAYRTQQCNSCHGDQTWKIPRFNHEGITRFALKGAHAQLKCTDCHKQSASIQQKGPKFFKWAGLGKTCNSCHQDIHKENLSPAYRAQQCSTCHGDQTWKIAKFSHEEITRFALKGAHAQLKCTDCHKQSAPVLLKGSKSFHWASLSGKCVSCHQDFHHFGTWSSKKQPQPTNCSSCHSDVHWKPSQSFDHFKHTGYPIDGKHVGLACNECHVGGKSPWPAAKSGTYRWKELAAKTCETCHTSPHRSSTNREFSQKKCSECHFTSGWKLMDRKGKGFDHSLATRFPLTGKHQGLKCDQCHLVQGKKTYRFEGAEGKFCVTCHENVHKDQFSPAYRDRSCAECHTANDFKKRLPFDHQLTGFQLKEKHAPLKCEDCHKKTTLILKSKPPIRASKFHFPELSGKNCAACHNDPHKGNLGGTCTECHSDAGWKNTRDFHKNFTLTGVHYSLSCNECHKENRRLVGLSSKCMVCHQKDDIHNGTLPSCGDCHRQHFWEVAGFKHSLTLFPLRGTHRTLDCSACHNRGIYKGTPNRCIDCHLRDAQAATSFTHSFPAQQDCTNCHNHFVWQR